MGDKRDISFVINKEKRTIVCRIRNNKFIVYHRMEKYIKDAYFNPSELNIDDEFVGCAYCAVEDEWDEEKGKELALLRAKKKRCIAVNKKLRWAIDKLQRQIDDLNKYGIHTVPSEGELSWM